MTATWEPLPPLPAPSRLRPASVVALYWVRLRRRWLQELLAVAGIAAGVALLYASSVATSSLSRPVKELNQGIVGDSQLQLVARGADGFPDSLYRAVDETPGVRLAAPILQAPASLVGRSGRRSVVVYGSDQQKVRLLRGSLTQGFSASELARQEVVAITTSVADGLGLHTGDLTRLQIAGRSQTVGIVVLSHRDIGSLSATSIALAPLAYLQRLTGLPHRLSRVLVVAAPGRVEAVRDRLQRLGAGRVDVRAADYEPRLFDRTAEPTLQATTVSSALSSLVGFMFAACAMLMTVGARRALALDLRRSGYTNGQIGAILLFDAMVLGVAAVLVGLALGELVSRHGFSADAGFLEGAFPIGDARVVTWSSIVVAAAGGMVAAAAGVLAPMARFLGAGPERRRSAAGSRARAPWLTPRRLRDVSGLLLLAVAVAITIAAPRAVVAGLVALTLAVVLLLPAIFDAALDACRWLSRRVPRTLMSVELALPQLAAPTWRVRSLAIATIGALAVLGASAIQGARANLQTGLDRAAADYVGVAGIWVTPSGPGDLFAVSPVPPLARRRLAATPGIGGVALYRGSFLDIAGNRVWVRAPAVGTLRPVPAVEVLEGSAEAAMARFQVGGWATLSRALAQTLHVRVGERFTLPSPSPIMLRLSAITANLGWPGGGVILNSEDYARGWGTRNVSAYQLTLKHGVTGEQGRVAVQRVLGAGSALRVETADQRERRERAASRSGLARLRQISSLMLIAAVIAMAAAMAALLWQQRSSVARQKLDGHRTAVMWRALAVESGVLIGTGCFVGAVASLLGQVLFSRGLVWISGFPVIATVRLETAAVSFGLVTGVAVLGLAVPGYLVARVRPSLRSSD